MGVPVQSKKYGSVDSGDNTTLPDAAPSCASGSVGRFADFVLVNKLERRPTTDTAVLDTRF